MRFRDRSKSQPVPSAAISAGISGAESSSGLALVLEWSSLLVAGVTVCILPWLLGGAIPKARLVLQVGTIVAAVLTLLARLLSRRSFAMPPLGSWPLLGMAAVGILQLQPWLPSAISLMDHAVHSELRSYIPKTTPGTATGTLMSRISADSRSAAPASTRHHVAQWIAVSVLFCVVADSLSRASQLRWMLGLMCMNASLFTVLSLQQLFHTGSRDLSEPWIISKTLPFGSFVNPNNASGWLLVHMAMAVGLVVITWGKNSSIGWSRSNNRPLWRDWILMAKAIIRGRMASLNTIQIFSVVTAVLLLTGIAATLSRSGIAAAILCLVVTAASRMQLRNSLWLLVPFSILLAGASVFLTAFELDTLVLAELMTLKDPVTESTSRLLHWSDSLGSLRDFPILGSGQGAYAWSTLPYQRHGGSTWFMNADNQYVEILVESGVLGLALYVGFGVLMTSLSIQLILNPSKIQSDRGLRSHRIAIGLAGIALMASQAIVAFFDFGIGLCSTMAAIAVFGGILTAIHGSQRSTPRTPPTWYAIDGGVVGWVLRLAFVVAAWGSVTEQRHADQVYPAIVESARLFDAPVKRSELERLPDLDKQLTAAAKNYPDDLIVRVSLVAVLEARFRLRMIDALAPPGPPVDGRQLERAWMQLTPLGLAERVVLLKKNLDPAGFQRLKSLLKTLSVQFPWHDMARDVSRQMPLAPGLAVDAAAGSISIGSLDESQLSGLNAVRFTDPSGIRRLYQCGMVCLIADFPKEAVIFWKQSLKVSERFRIRVLVDSLRSWTPDQALEMFAPAEYVPTVRAAFAKSRPELTQGLWKLADLQWRAAANSPTADEKVQRANHLLHRESPEAALKWIDGCLAEFPEMLELRRLRAETLEKLGELDDAIGEWMRYEHFDPQSPLSAASIKRLIDAKHK